MQKKIKMPTYRKQKLFLFLRKYFKISSNFKVIFVIHFESLKYPTVGMQTAYALHIKEIQHLYFYKINRLILPFVGKTSFYSIQIGLHWGKQDKQNFT